MMPLIMTVMGLLMKALVQTLQKTRLLFMRTTMGMDTESMDSRLYNVMLRQVSSVMLMIAMILVRRSIQERQKLAMKWMIIVMERLMNLEPPVRLFSFSMRMVMGMELPVSFNLHVPCPVGMPQDLGDCDDADAAVTQPQIEVCDEIDNNCDALVDDADPTVIFATTDVWYADADGDGFGIASDTVQRCEIPQGYIDNADDCNDNKVFQCPGAPELCNNQDDDCDGVIDNAPVNRTAWYVDGDGDGHGMLVDTSSISNVHPDGYDLLACPYFHPMTGLPGFQPGFSQFKR